MFLHKCLPFSLPMLTIYMLIKWHLAVFYLFAIFECIFNDVYFKIMLLVNNEGTFIYVYVTFFVVVHSLTRLNLIVAFETFTVTF